MITEKTSNKNPAVLAKPQSLGFGRQIAYAVGNLGWATLIHIIYSFMVYFYIPPKKANLPPLITDVKFFGLLNVIVMVAALGRAIEAVTDPYIAGLSDKSTSHRGRRIPFMMIGFIPAAVFCALIFMPPNGSPTTMNLVWVIAMQVLYYPFFSFYAIPHYALLIEVTHTERERINLATFTSLAYALSSLTSALVPVIATMIQKHSSLERLPAMQWAIVILCVFSAICMLVPILFISERKYSSGYPGRNIHKSESKHQPVWESLKTTFRNPYFRKFVFSDCVYWTGLNIVSTGMLYYITVLLGLKDDKLMTFMVILLVSSFSIYPVVNLVGKRVSRKNLIVLAFSVFACVFALIFFLGRLPLSPMFQATVLCMLAAVPFAFLGILPNTILADIAEHDMLVTGTRREGMFFAARTMIMKAGQTIGVILFTMLLSLGKEPGQDIGIRLTGIAGVVLCLLAAFIFYRYDEHKVLAEIEAMKNKQAS